VLQDLRFTVRLIAKERWFSAVIIVALALGIGLNATVFTLVNAVLIRGLPFKDSTRLYMLAWEPRTGQRSNVSLPELQDWRAQSHAFAGLAAFSQTQFNISDDRGVPEQQRGARLSANAFGILGQQPLLGRDFAPGEDQKGAEPVVMLGYSVWKNRYNSDPNILGKTLRLNGTPTTIIGVMPDRMKFPTNAELWTPFVPTDVKEYDKRDARSLNVFGRLRDGATYTQARSEMNAIARRLAAEYPATNKDLQSVVVETFNERFNGGPIRMIFLAMMGAVGFVLLIACANVANLLLSRSAHRAREIAVRFALGATRWRVVRQLLVESVVLGCIAGVFGLLLALVSVRLFDAAVATSGKPYWIEFTIDYTVVAFLAGVCILTGVLFGFAPALHVSKTNVNEVLKEGGRGNAGGRRARWMSGTMVVVELALTVVLLVGAGLMIRSFVKMYTMDIGIRTDHLMQMRMQLPDSKYPTPDVRRAFYDRLEQKLASIPGIDAAALTTSVPPFGSGPRTFEIEGKPPLKPGEEPPQVAVVTISPGFFDVVAVTIRRGRAFTPTDGAAGSETIVINERMAAQFFPGEDPMGRRIKLTQRDPPPDTPPPAWRTIVGISPSIRHNSPQESVVNSVVYVPYRQDPPGFASLLVRSQLPPGSVMSAVRREVQALDQDQPVFTIETLDQALAQARWPFRVFGSLFAIFAFIALVLSAVGLYAVMAYSVTQRTQEIGVRMALGADARQVSWLILRRGLSQVAIGLVLGLAGAFGLSKVLRAILVQITPSDPVTFVAISVLLTAVAIAACLIPARRATRVDPLTALRAD
jgi:predicted permease